VVIETDNPSEPHSEQTMDNGTTIQEAMARKPFQPIRVYVKDGRIMDIPARFYAAIGSRDIVIGQQAPDEAEGICSPITMIPLSWITRVETLTSRT
jgi:hypothetical protein